MEYANNGTLRNYLKENFKNLTWNDKLILAFQLVYAVSCLHGEGIVHRDLVINQFMIYYNCFYLMLILSLFNLLILNNSTPKIY